MVMPVGPRDGVQQIVKLTKTQPAAWTAQDLMPSGLFPYYRGRHENCNHIRRTLNAHSYEALYRTRYLNACLPQRCLFAC